MEKIKIAKIVNVFGIRGEVKLYHYSDNKERFEELDRIIVSKKAPKRSSESKRPDIREIWSSLSWKEYPTGTPLRL